MKPSAAVRVSVVPAAPKGLRSVGYTGRVRLGGRLGSRVTDTQATYGGLDNNDVLHGFRSAAGMAAPGRPMQGWASETTQMTFGQWVSGLARLGVATGEPDLVEKASRLLDGYAQTLPPDGSTQMNIYAWEKLLCGAVDLASIGGDLQAASLLSRLARGERFDRTRAPARANDFSGEEPHFLIEWYTLSENLYKAYRLTGDNLLAELGKQWHYDAYWDRFRQTPAAGEKWDVPAWLHAYSHVNTFASAAAVYEMYGDPGHLNILGNAYRWLSTTQTFSTGGFGPHEFTMPEDGTLGRTLEWLTDSAEITCGSWAIFKLVSALLEHTGEARYIDLVERLVYNGIGATVPVQPDGKTPYYADYRLGVATKLPYWHAWPCCSGTYIQAVAHLHDLVYFSSEDGVTIGLYVPSSFNWTLADQQVTLALNTQFPEQDDSEITLTMERPAEFTLRLRVPSWSRFGVSINSQQVAVTPRPDEWVELTREWRDGDVVQVRLGPQLRAEAVDVQHPNRVAMLFGPVVLVQDVDWVTPFDAPIPWAMLDWEAHLKRTATDLVFRPVQPGTHRMLPGEFRPFYEVPERRPYRMYHDLGSRRIV